MYKAYVAMPQVIKLFFLGFGWVHLKENEYNLRGFKNFCVPYPENIRLRISEHLLPYIRQNCFKKGILHTLSKNMFQSIMIIMHSHLIYTNKEKRNH